METENVIEIVKPLVVCVYIGSRSTKIEYEISFNNYVIKSLSHINQNHLPKLFNLYLSN